MKNKSFLISLLALVLAFGGIVACGEQQPDDNDEVIIEQPVISPSTDDNIREEVPEVPMEDETLNDLDVKIEDPELTDPNVKFDENLEEDMSN